MNNKQSRATHPLVARYLHDLDALLQGIDPVEKAEVVEGVREHIDTSLVGTDHTDADVRSALDEVGPATAVAEEAYNGRLPPGAGPRPPVTSRAWLPLVVAGFEALTLLTVTFIVAGAGVVSSGSVTETSANGHTTTTTMVDSSFHASFGWVAAAVIAASPFWLVVLVLVGISALWTTREKAVLMALPLAAVIVFTLLPLVGYALFGINGVYVGAWTALALIVGGGGFLTWVPIRRAVRRSEAATATGRGWSGA